MPSSPADRKCLRSEQVESARKRSRTSALVESVAEHVPCKYFSTDNVKGHLPAILEATPYEPLLHCGGRERLGEVPGWVLVEEDYVKLLDYVIRRDFFPYLDKLYRCTGLERPELRVDEEGSRTFWPTTDPTTFPVSGGESMSSHNGNEVSVVKHLRLKDGRRLKVDVANLTLSKFQNLFTSEDNASFVALVAAEKAKLAEEQMACMEVAVLNAENRNREVMAAQAKGERPCRLIYANCAEPRNALIFPVSSERTRVHHIITMGALRESAASGNDWARLTLERSSLDSSEPDRRVVALCVSSKSRDDAKATSRGGSVVPSNTRFAKDSANDGTSQGDALMNNLIEQQTARKVRLEGDARRFQLLDSMVEEGLFSKSALARRLLEDTDYVCEASTADELLDSGSLVARMGASPAPSCSESLVRHPITGHPLLRSPRRGAAPGAPFALPEAPRKETTAHRLLAKAILRRSQGSSAAAEGAAALVTQQCSRKRHQQRLTRIFSTGGGDSCTSGFQSSSTLSSTSAVRLPLKRATGRRNKASSGGSSVEPSTLAGVAQQKPGQSVPTSKAKTRRPGEAGS